MYKLFENYFDAAHFFVRCYRYRLRTEKLQIATLMQLRLEGTTVIDIGANRGIYCFWLARAVGRGGRVIAIDPQPEMVRSIERQRFRFGWENVAVVNAGLSNIEGSGTLARKKVGDGSASLERARRGTGDQTIRVQIKRLDDIATGISRLGYVKCDVEGHELKVFLGGHDTIRRLRPIVQFESSVGDKNTSLLFDYFRSLNYSGVMMLGNSYHHHSALEQIPHYKLGLTGHRDFLFYPREALGTIIPAGLASQFPAD